MYVYIHVRVRVLVTCIRYDVIIVSRYVIKTKYMRMRTYLAGSIAACATCLSNELCTVSLDLFVSTLLAATQSSMTRSCTGQSRKLLLHV